MNSFASSGGQGGPSFESGYVTARALVRGANGFPIFVEYDEEGEVVNIIGEAANDLQDAELMSASEQASEGQVLFLAQETRPDPSTPSPSMNTITIRMAIDLYKKKPMVAVKK